MNAIVFDTSRLAQKLEAAGFTPQQAQGAATAISEVLGEQVATQRDVQDIRRDIADLRKDLLETEARLRADAAAESKALRSELRDMAQQLTIRLGGMIAGAVVLVAALAKLL